MTAMPDTVAILDGSTPTPTGTPASPSPVDSSLVTFKQAFTGAIPSTVYLRLKSLAVDAVADFGADPTGVADSTTAMRNAAATGHQVVAEGIFKLTDMVTLNDGQAFGGSDRYNCVLAIGPDFVNTGDGVLRASPAGLQDPAAQIHDVTIQFAQPDTTNYNSLIRYKPAIYGQNAARLRIENCRITGAWDGIDIRGILGAQRIDGLEMDAYHYGIQIDGAADTIRIKDLHWWPFGNTRPGAGLSANLLNLFVGNSTALRIGRCDGLMLTDTLLLGGIGIDLVDSVTSPGIGAIIQAKNVGFDSFSGIRMRSANPSQVMASNSYFSQELASNFAIDQTSGDLELVNCYFQPAVTLSAPLITVNGASAVFKMSNSRLNTGSFDMTHVAILNGIGILIGNNFQRSTNITVTTPTITTGASAGRLTAIGNRATDKGISGSGSYFIAIPHDDFHRIIGNTAPGWANSFPTATNGVYASN